MSEDSWLLVVGDPDQHWNVWSVTPPTILQLNDSEEALSNIAAMVNWTENHSSRWNQILWFKKKNSQQMWKTIEYTF